MKRKHIIFLLLFCLGVIFTSTVHGDNYGISSYEQLMEYLNSPQLITTELIPTVVPGSASM